MKGPRNVRYAYAVTSALLLTGSAAALITGQPVGAQVAQNEKPGMPRAAAPAGAPGSFADLAEQLAPAVVNISTTQKVRVPENPFGGLFGQFFGQVPGGNGGTRTREAQSLGSGFIVSADGYIVTNNHVVAPGNPQSTVESITVTLPDRTEYEAELVGRDVGSDLAVLKVKPSKSLPFVKFGNSDKARVGDWILAIGNPFGLGGTVTSGIISAVARSTGSGSYADSFLQTDASINSGNSGGPMFDMNGDVIGINNRILSPSGGNVGIGFAIPSNFARPIVEALMKGKAIERGYLGIQFSPLTDDLAASLGVDKNSGEFVQSVVPGEPAEKAGIKAGDVIVKVNGEDITPDNRLSYIVANLDVGARVPVEVLRNGKRVRTTVTIGKRPSEEALAQSFGAEPEDDFSDQDERSTADAAQDLLGVAVVELTDSIRRQIGVGQDISGVVVAAVDPSSDAAQKGLRRGDVIMTFDNRQVTSPDALDSAIETAKRSGKTAVLLRVKRRTAQPQFVPVRLKSK